MAAIVAVAFTLHLTLGGGDRIVHVTDDSFQKEVLESEVPVLVDFWAVWCGPCHMVAPTVEKMAQEFDGKIKVAKVDVDKNPGLSRKYKITGIPALMLFQKGEPVRNWVGVQGEDTLRSGIRELL